MSGETICGIDVRAFAKKPTYQELAAIVARWDSDDQARFLIALGERIKFSCAVGRDVMLIADIADAVRAEEDRLCCGDGSRLIGELYARLEQSEAAQ